MSSLSSPSGEKRMGAEVHLTGVVHLYPSLEGDVVALRGVDLDIWAGESVARTKKPNSGAKMGPFSKSAARKEKLPDFVRSVMIDLATSSGGEW